MGFDVTCVAVIAALRNDASLSALTVLDQPVDQIVHDLSVMVYPFGGAWSEESLDGDACAAEIRVALGTKERQTTAGGFAADLAVLRPYADLIPRALARAKRNHFGDTVMLFGGDGTPWLRMERPTRQQTNGLDMLWLLFTIAVTFPEETPT